MEFNPTLKRNLLTVAVVALFFNSAFAQDTELKDRFESEYRAWKEQTGEITPSSAPEYNEHLYEMIKMGAPVLPFIIEKMEKHEFGLDFLLESAFHLISRKNLEREDWPEGKLGDAHTAAAMYIDWWHNGLKETERSFDRYYQEWKGYLAEKNPEEAEKKLKNIKNLGIAAMPFMINKIEKGDLEFIKIISDHTNESLSADTSKDECISWWNENHEKYTIVQEQ